MTSYESSERSLTPDEQAVFVAAVRRLLPVSLPETFAPLTPGITVPQEFRRPQLYLAAQAIYVPDETMTVQLSEEEIISTDETTEDSVDVRMRVDTYRFETAHRQLFRTTSVYFVDPDQYNCGYLQTSRVVMLPPVGSPPVSEMPDQSQMQQARDVFRTHIRDREQQNLEFDTTKLTHALGILAQCGPHNLRLVH